MTTVVPVSDVLRKEDIRRIEFLLPYILPIALCLFPHKGAILDEAMFILSVTFNYILNHWDEIEMKGELTIHSAVTKE